MGGGGVGGGLIVFREIVLPLNTFCHPFKPGFDETKVVMMSWSLHAVVQPVKPNKRTLRKR